MSREEINKIDYMVVCVNEFAERFIMNYKDAFNYLLKYNAIKFLNENYGIEHTLSIEDAIDDIVIIAKNNGGNLIWNCNNDNKYDLVVGPVADDDLALFMTNLSPATLLWTPAVSMRVTLMYIKSRLCVYFVCVWNRLNQVTPVYNLKERLLFW